MTTLTRGSYGTRQPKPHKHQRKRARQDRALKIIKELKTDARRDFQKAKKEALPSKSKEILPADQRTLYHLKKSSSVNKIHDQTRKARYACHSHFWRFSWQVDLVRVMQLIWWQLRVVPYWASELCPTSIDADTSKSLPWDRVWQWWDWRRWGQITVCMKIV